MVPEQYLEYLSLTLILKNYNIVYLRPYYNVMKIKERIGELELKILEPYIIDKTEKSD